MNRWRQPRYAKYSKSANKAPGKINSVTFLALREMSPILAVFIAPNRCFLLPTQKQKSPRCLEYQRFSQYCYVTWRRERVRGSIDGYEIGNYHLMPSGKGTLFLSVKADIRKKIKKEAGDYVRIVLYSVNEPLEVPGELLVCLREDAEALQFFNSLGESQRHNYVKWIYSAKTEQTKVDRIAKTLARLAKHQKFADRG